MLSFFGVQFFFFFLLLNKSEKRERRAFRQANGEMWWKVRNKSVLREQKDVRVERYPVILEFSSYSIKYMNRAAVLRCVVCVCVFLCTWLVCLFFFFIFWPFSLSMSFLLSLCFVSLSSNVFYSSLLCTTWNEDIIQCCFSRLILRFSHIVYAIACFKNFFETVETFL